MNATAWGMLFVPVLVLTGLSGWLARPPVAAEQLLLDVPPLKCSLPPRFRVAYVREPGGLIVSDKTYRFMGVSWLEADICAPGTLTFTASGQVAGGAAPELRVALDSVPLFHARFSEARPIKLVIARPGRLTLSYLNDYYRSDARVATLAGFQLDASGCHTVQVTDSVNGQYNTLDHTASLSSADPLRVRPCARGILSLRIFGRAGNRQYPQLQVRQDEHVLAIFQTSDHWQLVRQRIDASPLTITLMNPYFKELGDRNLILEQLHFITIKNDIP